MSEGGRRSSLLFVLDHFGSGGAQRQMVTLASSLVRRGHRVTFFTYHSGHDFFRPAVSAAGCDIHAVDVRRIGFARVLRSLRHVVRASACDAVLAFMDTPAICAELAGLGSRMPPVVVSERVDLEASPSWRLNLRIALHRLAAAVVANSATCAQQLRASYPWLGSRLRVIPNGVDLEQFAPAQPGTEQPRGATSALRLVAVGTINARKNVLAAVEALKIARERLRVVPVLTWVGKTESDPESRLYRERVDVALARADLGDNWLWAGEQREVCTLLRNADALLHPATREGLANAICEALACGLPVLASARGDTPWLLGGGERGVLFDPNSPETIATAMQRLAEMPAAQRAAMSAAARRFAESELSGEHYVSRYEQLFLELTG